MSPPSDAALLERFRALVAARLGLRFDPRQDGWLAEVLRRRSDGADPEPYLATLEQAPQAEELDALAAELTVGETFFFRNPEQFDALRHEALPALLRRPRSRQQLRVLSAGCASGEEAYSLAICLQGAGLPAQACDWQVHAIDLNPEALRKARQASYGAWSLRASSEQQRAQWFVASGEPQQLEPLPLLRQRLTFEQRSLCRPDPAFWQAGRFDVVFCRNVLMYLDAAALRIALANLATALAPGGFLFLGHAETLREQAADFQLRQGRACFYYQRVLPEAAPPVRSAVPAAALEPKRPASEAVFDLLRAERHPQALRLTEALLGEAGSDAMLLLLQALLLIEAARLGESQQVCARLLALEGAPAMRADAAFVEALGREARGDLPGAEQGYQQAGRLDRGFAMPHLRLGLLARRRGEIVTLRRELQRALVLLDGEDERRLLLFGGGFGRPTLKNLCRSELGEALA